MAGNQAPSPISIAEAFQGIPTGTMRVGPDDSLAYKARAWFLEAMMHPLWIKYMRESREDLGFYVGGDAQWSVDGSMEDLQVLKDANRAVVSINHCQAIVDVLVGFERQNRFDLRAAPEGEEDAEGAELWSWVLKWAQDKAEIPEYKSEGFNDGLIRGMSCWQLGLDWNADPVNGEIKIEVLTPGEDIIWDPRWTRYDLSDARYVIRFKWAAVDDLKAQYPEHKTEIEAGVADVTAAMQTEPNYSTDGSGYIGGAYGVVRGHPLGPNSVESLFYDKDEQRALIMEVWYRTFKPKWIVVNEETHDIHHVDEYAEAVLIRDSDPRNMRIVKRLQRQVKMGVVIPSTFTVIEEGDSPYENDIENYPFVPYMAKRNGDEVMGVIRNLKDPQRIENRRIGQILDILGRYAAMKPMYEEGALVDPRTVQNQNDNAPVVVKRGRKDPGWYIPPLAELARVLTEFALQAKMHIREVSGVNTDLLGFRSDDTSGIAIARRQAQGQVISTVYFDNLKRSHKLLGKMLAKRLQQKMTAEQVIRLTGSMGDPVTVKMNPRDKKASGMTMAQYQEMQTKPNGVDSRPMVIRDVSSLKYDIVIEEVPSTPSARQTALLALLEVVGKIPDVAPALIDVIIDLADVPQKKKIIKRLQLLLPPPIQAAEGIGAPGGMPGQGGTGAPGGGNMPGGGPGGPGPGPGAPAGPGGVPGPLGGPPIPVPPGQPPAPLGSPTQPAMPKRPGKKGHVGGQLRKALGVATGGPATGTAPIGPA